MHVFWYGAIAALWAGFLAVEGFGLGVGAMLPVAARRDEDRTAMTMSIMPAWDGNEGWLFAAGAATFAAYNVWFDSLLSGFTLLFAAVFVGLVVRKVALQRRLRTESVRGRARCDAVVFVCSVVPAALLGVLFANFLHGVDLDRGGSVHTDIGGLLSPYALLGSAATVVLLAFYGTTFLAMRTIGRAQLAARHGMTLLGPLALSGAVAFVSWTEVSRDVGVLSALTAAALCGAIVVAGVAGLLGHHGLAFRVTMLAIVLVPTWTFSTLWPDVLLARNNSTLSLTVYNTAASHTTFVVLGVAGIELAAVVLVYAAWSYWILRARVTGRNLVVEPVWQPIEVAAEAPPGRVPVSGVTG